jgi:hypothetical protein
MRSWAIFPFLRLCHHGLRAQCAAFAGQDTITCNTWMGVPPLMLGGSPVATGGVETYTYAWSAHHSITIGANT